MKDRENHPETSRAVKSAMKSAAKSARWNSRGEPKPGLNRKGMPGYAGGTGTPDYIKAAGTRAEKFGERIVKDFGGGIQTPARHRIPDTYYSAGKPDRGSDPMIHMTDKNVAAKPDRKA